MPIIAMLLVFLLVFIGHGDAKKEFQEEPLFSSISAQAINSDQDHWATIIKIKEKKQDLKRTVTFYRTKIEHQLSKDEMRHLIKEANRLNIPEEILIKLLKIESNFDSDLVGPATKYGHAYGLAQFMENTAPWISNMANMEYEFNKLFDPYYSITLAATYLHYLQYGDGKSHVGYHDWHTSLTAYNRGMGGLRTYKRKYQTTVSTYSESIILGAESIAFDPSISQ
jgi:soluble lytic murein transglycosylase-like protein